MKLFFQKFSSKLNTKLNSVFFLYNGNNITDTDLTFEQLANIDDKKRNKMSIIVSDLKSSIASQFIFAKCEGADESMKEFAKMVILLVMTEYQNEDDVKKSIIIRNKFEEKYGNDWCVSIVKEGGTSFRYYGYFMGIKFKDYKITIGRTSVYS